MFSLKWLFVKFIRALQGVWFVVSLKLKSASDPGLVGWCGLTGLTVSSIFNFQSLLTVILLLMCTCAYIYAWHPASWTEIKLGCWVYFGSVPELVNVRVLTFQMLWCDGLQHPLHTVAWKNARIQLQSDLNMKKRTYLHKIMERMVNPFIFEHWMR